MEQINIPATAAEAEAMLQEADRLQKQADALRAAVMAGIQPLRKTAGISQTVLASASDTPQAIVSRVENGYYKSATTLSSPVLPGTRLTSLVGTISAADDLRRARRKETNGNRD